MAPMQKKLRLLNSNSTNTTSTSENNDHEQTLPEAMPNYHFVDFSSITPSGQMPQKKYYRSRAHCNPLSYNDNFPYPENPSEMEWVEEGYYTKSRGFQYGKVVVPTILDIGCGFGGLTLALSPLFPNDNILGIEIRAKVAEYVRLRILAKREEFVTKLPSTAINDERNTVLYPEPLQIGLTDYLNVSILRGNSMKTLTNFFHPSSLNKIFICFPDPHFKVKNHRRRIVTVDLLSEYAFTLKDGGRIYAITDVLKLHEWHVRHLNSHPLFKRLDVAVDGSARVEEDGDMCPIFESDPCVALMRGTTEEGAKVERAGARKHWCVYERIARVEDYNVDWKEASFFNEKVERERKIEPSKKEKKRKEAATEETALEEDEEAK